MKKVTSLILSFLFVCSMFILPIQTQASTTSPRAGTVAVSSGSLNVRSAASTGASVVASLYKGSYITLLSKSGSWWYIRYAKNGYGYCHANYITQVSSYAATVQIQSGSLNVRSGASTSYARVDSLYQGETVVVLSASGDWRRILYHGTKTGYVSAQYLSSSSAVTYAKITLSVPNFKQTDSRWANTLIGSSGKTIAQIGCATTAVAMMESYRTGTTIYPHVMSKQLTYTSSGNLYWPSHYTTIASSSAYLSKIYSLLQSGKPVLFGAKTSAGKQHWVVITGFTGGNTLSASSFTIHDPGSTQRTTLQQFLNAYPIFYKYFHY